MAHNNKGLPPRPSTSAAGPSRTNDLPPQSGSMAPPLNLSGGYGGYQSASMPAYNPAFAYPAVPSYPHYPMYPYQAYGAYPQMQMTNTYTSYGQSLFQQPQYTPPFAQPFNPSAEPPNKRQKGNDGHIVEDPMAWRNCSVKGCKFVGPGDKVEQHEGDRHLIFRNGPKVELSEEEERYARTHKGPPPPVLGTSITLHTEEDIAKWVAERKAKWPSAKRIQDKNQERQAAIARGENLDRKGKRGHRALDAAAQAENWGREETVYNPSDSRGRGRGRENGRGRGRGSERGRGGRRGELDGHGHDPQRQQDHERTSGIGQGRGDIDGSRGGRGRGRGRGGADLGRIRDAGYDAVRPKDAETQSASTHTIAQSKPVPSVSGIAGLGEYASSSSSSDLPSSEDSSSDSTSDTSDSDDEEGVQLRAVLQEPVVDAQEEVPKEGERPICPYWARNGRCRLGDKCPNAHSVSSQASQKAPATGKARPLPRQPPQLKPNPFARPSLLGQLLANPIQNTLSQLTQTIRFLVANNMLEGVELEPGQAEEQERKENLVSVVSDKPASDMK